MDSSLSDTPHLRWVIAEGMLCEVSKFRDLRPGERPTAYCPVCGCQVTLKLGKKRAHHFAHRPEDVCSTTQPETAVHLNCKFHIYRQLQVAKQVYTSKSCRRCGKREPILWKQDWDEVVVEYKMDSIRPDIALLQEGKVIGVIEIFVTHMVDEEKASRLEDQGIDWVELHGHGGIYEEPNAWTVDKPLNILRQHPKLPQWLCPKCQEAEAQQEYRKTHPPENHWDEIYCARMMDAYYHSGKKYRHTFYVKYAFVNDKNTRIWIQDENRNIIAQEYAPITDQSHKRLNEAFRRKHLQIKERTVILDDAMGWTGWLPGKKFVPRDTYNFPFRYEWNESRKEWIFQSWAEWKHLD